MSLNVRSRQFTKSYLSGGLYKIPVRTGLDLGRKISVKILKTALSIIVSLNPITVTFVSLAI